MIVTSFQDSKLCEKQISPTFSYFLINSAVLYHFLANLLAQNQKMSNSKTNILIAIFLAGVSMYQKYQISLLVGYKTARPKPGDWQ